MEEDNSKTDKVGIGACKYVIKGEDIEEEVILCK